MIEKLPVKFVTCKKIAKDTYEVIFEYDPNLFSFAAGQYVRVTVPRLKYKDPKGSSRDFSIVSSPNTKGNFSVAFRNTGSGFKKTLIQLKKGTTVEITGPQEIISLKKTEGKSVVFIAGGIGITPFLSMIRFATEKKLPQKIILIYGNSERERAAYLEELKNLEKQNPNFKMEVFFAHITKDIIQKSVKDAVDKCYCLAGPSAMTGSVAKELADMGVKGNKICIEEFSGYENKEVVLVDSIREKAEARLEALLAALDKSAIVSMTDVNGNITYVNRIFEQISKYSEKELIGQNHRILKSGYHSEEFYKEIWDTISSGKVWHGQIKNKAKDGSFYWVESSISPTFDEKGEIIGYVAIRFPITDLKNTFDKLMESEMSLDLRTKLTPVGIIEWDKGFNVTLWNPAAEKIFGYANSEAMGRHANFIIPKEVRPHVDEIWTQLLSGKVTLSTNENITKDGRTIICEWHNAPLTTQEGKVFGVVSMILDVTTRIETERKLAEREQLLNDAQKLAGLGIYKTYFTKDRWESSEILNQIFGIDKNFVRSVEGWATIIHPDDRKMMTDYLTNDVIGKKHDFDKEYRIVQKNSGQERWVHGLGKMTFDKKNRPLTMIGTIQDITQRKNIEEGSVLQATALQASADAIVITDKKGTIEWINNAFTKLTGYDSSEAIGHNMSIIKSGLQKDAYYKKFWDDILSGKTIRKEVINRRKDGNLYNEEETVTPVKDENGQIIHFISIKRDITERKKSEDALRESEEKFRQFTENISEVLWMTDPAKNTMLYISAAYEKIWGRTVSSLYKQPKNWIDAIHPDDRQRVLKAAIEKQVKGEYNEEYRIIRPDGKQRIINDRAFPIKNKEGRVYRVVGIAQDITEKKEIEREIYDSEERFRLASKAINNIIWDWDLVQDTILWSEGINILFDYKIENLATPYEWWVDNIHPEDRARIRKSITGVVEGDGDYWRDEYRFVTGNGTYAYIEDHGYVMRDKKRKAYRMIGAMSDLTEKKVEEEKIRTNDERFYKLLENSQDVILISDPKGGVSYVSPSVKRVLGFTPEEYKGIVMKQVHQDDLPIVYDAVKKVMDPHSKGPVTSVFRVKNKKGEWRWIESIAIYENDEVVSGIVSNCHDITELKNNEENAEARAFELAKTNALMVGRELRMIELKKTIKELEEKLMKYKK
ncbi:MAG: PAS domain S-box protein [Candidatus Levybacteria bacterium]|nr:PAS domain S-box protein [Candidatus Levybacteria bacterium]